MLMLCSSGFSSGGSTGCTNCSVGTYSDGRSSCMGCAPGTYASMNGMSTCTDCAAGTFSDGTHSCALCKFGFYSPQNGSSACSLCYFGIYGSEMGSGQYGSEMGSGQYGSEMGYGQNGSEMGSGQYGSEMGSGQYGSEMGSSTCFGCKLGTYSNKTQGCSACDAGSFSSQMGLSSCTACYYGTYSDSGYSACVECDLGAYTTQEGSTACLACEPGNYYNRYVGDCVACSKGPYLSGGSFNSPKCSPDQFLTCKNATSFVCQNCSKCMTGEYLVNCSAGANSTCIPCTNKYEVSQCGAPNITISLYTGPGLLTSNCPWKCVDSYYNSGGVCKECSISSCSIGTYRGPCTEFLDGPCISCTGKPDNAFYTSTGVPYNRDNCTWQCNAQFYLQTVGNVSKCTACKQPSTCPIGEYLAECQGRENYACKPCSAISNAFYISQGSCDFECNSGYFQNGSTCQPCSTNVVCISGQERQNCTAKHDAVCTQCKIGIEYQLLAQNGSYLCLPCSKTLCTNVGKYREQCSAAADASCASCTNGPMHSNYTSAGANGENNCTWQCNAGFEATKQNSSGNFVCSACTPGKYSRQSDPACISCAAGTYSAQYGMTSADLCIPCQAGYFSTEVGATSISVCNPCPVGSYQASPGKSFCTPCSVNMYGTVSASATPDSCLPCRAADTSTRGAVGQQYEIACICNANFYRIDNTTVECQTCPPGLVCDGYSSLVPVVNGSKWESITFQGGNYYRLKHCPPGYYYPDIFTDLDSALNPSLILASQQCTACDAGKECVSPTCIECSQCQPGYYKSCPGPNNCEPCNPNTYTPLLGSLSCNLCGQGTTTNGKRGCIYGSECVCDSKNYDLGIGEGCQVCPAGATCFGNSSIAANPLLIEASVWEKVVDTDGKSKYNLTYCPFGYYLAGTISNPGQLQCILCAAGFECTNPPCYGACSSCKPGFYKSANITYPTQVPRSSFDALSDQKYTRVWVEEPCLPCPVDTFRRIEGGTEIGSCTTCPAKSTTNGLVSRTSPSDCKCDIFYYQQAISPIAELTCADCPEGAVCTSDRACALGRFGSESFKIGDTRGDLKCPNSKDVVYGTWQRNTSGEYRLISCPPGFTLQRSDVSLTSDKCVQCPVESYSLVIVTSPAVKCRPCPTGASCPGGSVVEAIAGYWQKPINRRATEGTATAAIYQCPLGVCNSGNVCNNNRTGLVIA
jgi:hypothetical protein